MKQNLIFRTLALLVFIGVSISATFAQGAGKVAGKITDNKTGEPLIGVSVKVAEVAKGTTSDVEGHFNLGGLSAGTYVLEFSYVGYPTKRISDVIVADGKVTTLDVVMAESSQQLNQVVITGTARQENVSALYSSQKASVRVSDGISAEAIKRSPDRNTGEVLKRVSGTSIQENKFIVVRGLSDRYNTTMMNNAPLPSTEPDRKAFSFDIVPSNLIDQIVINKTAAADLPGDFAGGAVQMKTKDFPTQKTVDFTYTAGYNTVSTFKDFKSGATGKFDFLSFDDGSRNLPSSFPSTAGFTKATTEQKVQLTRSLSNSWGVLQQQAAPTQGFQLNYGNSYELKNSKKLGMQFSLSYRNANTITEQTREDYDAIESLAGKDYLFNYNDNIYRKTASLGGLVNLAYSFNKSKIAFKNFFSQSFENAHTDRSGISFDPDYEQINSQISASRQLVYNSTLEGQHSVGKKDLKLDWNIFSNASNRDNPDLRRIYYSRTQTSSDPFKASVSTGGSGSATSAGRFYEDLKDNSFGASINLTVPFKIQGKSQSLKIGGLNQNKYREYDFRQFGYKKANSEGSIENLLVLPKDQIFASQNISSNGIIIDEITDPRGVYEASGLLNAGYVMLTNELASKFKLNWGLRAESYLEKLNSSAVGPAEVDNSYFDLLPSANLIYSYNERTNFRVSYSNTLARAEFRELAPLPFLDFETNNVVQGNKNLKRSRINNFDIRWENYPSSGQIFSVSAFYKDFTNPIEQVVAGGSSATSKVITYQNADKATVYGLEFETRQKLAFLGSKKVWENLTAYANFSLMKSDVNLNRALFPNNNDSRALQGQSPYLVNGGITYTDNKWTLNALYNRIGRRITFVGFGNYNSGDFKYEYPDIFENPRDVIDFQISRRISRNRAEIKLNIADILNQRALLYQDVNGDEKYSSGTDQAIRTRNNGTNFNLSFNYKF